MDIRIVYEDDYLLVIDKPAGIVVNRAASVSYETIQDWAEKKFKVQSATSKIINSDFYKRAGIVHRLDKETSGLLIIAKTPQVFNNLQSQFKNRLVTKKYKALVHGVVTPEKGEIKASVGRLPWNRERFGIIPGGRTAVTLYKVISRYKLDDHHFTLLEVLPYTGRTHQIRIHLKYIGYPIVTDGFYGGRKTYREDLKYCSRLFLHAAFIRFEHPMTSKSIELKSNLPQDLREVIDKLEVQNDI